MQKIVLTAILTGLSALTFAQEKSPKKDIVYRKIEIKGNDTIVDITKKYDQLSEAERKELDNIKDGDVLFVAPKRVHVKRLDSAIVGKWKDGKNKEVMILGDDMVLSPGINHRIEKRVFLNGDSTKRKKIIVIDANGEEKVITRDSRIDEDMMIAVPASRKLVMKKRFSPEYELNFSVPAKGSVDVLVKDESGKEVYKETVKDFKGSYTKKIELLPGSYTIEVLQKGKQLLRYAIER